MIARIVLSEYESWEDAEKLFELKLKLIKIDEAYEALEIIARKELLRDIETALT